MTLWLFSIVKVWLSQYVKLTVTRSVEFGAVIPGLDVEISGPEISGPAADSIFRALRHLLRWSLVLAALPVEFWTTGWLAKEAGLGFQVSGFWPAVGGCVLANLAYAVVAYLGLGPRLTRARAAANRHFDQARASGLDDYAAYVEAQQVYYRAMKAGRDRDAPVPRGDPSVP